MLIPRPESPKQDFLELDSDLAGVGLSSPIAQAQIFPNLEDASSLQFVSAGYNPVLVPIGLPENLLNNSRLSAAPLYKNIRT